MERILKQQLNKSGAGNELIEELGLLMKRIEYLE